VIWNKAESRTEYVRDNMPENVELTPKMTNMLMTFIKELQSLNRSQALRIVKTLVVFFRLKVDDEIE
jgi:hypothetical protein